MKTISFEVNKSSYLWLGAVLLFLLPILVYAAEPDAKTANETYRAMELTSSAFKAVTDKVYGELRTTALRLLAILMLLQFTISNIKLIGQAADIDRVYAKLTGSLLWFTFCTIVIFDGSSFIYKGADYFLEKAAGWSGTGFFNPANVMYEGIHMFSNLMIASVGGSVSKGANIIGILFGGLAIFPAMLVMVVGLVIMVTCTIIAVKLFMLTLEVAIVVALSPLSFSLLGMDALRDQGIAPFKYLIALIYRIVMLAMLVSSIQTVGNNLTSVLDKISPDVGNPWSPIFAALFGYILIAFVAFKSDAIAASLANGSAQLSSSDMAGSVAAGVAAGMAVATGGAAAMAMASQGKQAMSDFVKGGAGGMQVGPSPGGGGSPSGSSSGSSEPPPSMNQESSMSAGDLKSMATSAGESPGASGLPMGSGADSAIQGAGSNSSLDKLVDHLTKQPSAAEKFAGSLGRANEALARESGAVQAQISTHGD